jgi:hypothetical protein
MIETKYIDITNISTQDDLYAALVKAIEPILEEEREIREKLEDEFKEFQAPFVEAFNAATVKEQEVAKKRLNPAKLTLETSLETIKKKFLAQMEKESKKYDREKARVEKWFKANTVEAEAVFQEAVAERRAEFEANLATLGESANQRIQPINEEYNILAEAMDRHVESTVSSEELVENTQEMVS